MAEMKVVVIDSVRISLTNQQRIVLLREMDDDRYLPIWIGPYEAESITIALQEIEIARPQTHDLLLRTIDQLKGKLLRVEIIALKGDVFYGNLVVQAGEEVLYLDSRPSDSIALAVRAHVPILVSRSVLELAGITQERDLQSMLEEESGHDVEGEESGDSKKRLSVFEDFLKNVNLEEGEDKTPDKDKNPDKDDEQDPPPTEK